MLSDINVDVIVQHHHWQRLSYRDFLAVWWGERGRLRQFGQIAPFSESQGQLLAEVNQGRWVTECPTPGCREATCVEVANPFFICLECGSPENDRKPYNVVFPSNMLAIEKVLLKRPAVSSLHAPHRSWQPGTSISKLKEAGPFHFSWTSPRTWVTAELVTAAIGNTHWRDNLKETAPHLVTTKGDIVVATAANALARLAVGANNTMPIADSGEATGIKWGIEPAADLIAAQGDILYGSAANTLAKLAAGTSGQFLKTLGSGANPAWASLIGFVLVGSDTTERTTTSTTAVDLVTISSLSIDVGVPILILVNFRKTSGAAKAVDGGLKLNSTVVHEAAAPFNSWTSETNQAESGVCIFFLGPRVTTYGRAGMMFYASAPTGRTELENFDDADMPVATITDVIIRGESGNASVTMGIDGVYVYSLPV